jgi:hypothetical protein
LERGGDFSQTLDVSGKVVPILDPTTGKQYPGNVIPNRMLKKSLTALPVETKARLYVSAYARNRYPTEFDVQLPVAGRACTCESSVAADSTDGR